MALSTTVYVGKYFEVRDHEQPTKYVFNGATRVAEVTGSLSANPRAQRLRLYPGWNLCSVPVNGPFPASGAKAISSAYVWNSASANYSEISFGQRILAGTVLWVKAKTNATIIVFGAYVHPTPWSVPPGGTYLPGAGLEVWSPGFPSSCTTWFFDGSSGSWSEHLWDGLATVSCPSPTVAPGQALYVRTVSPASLQPPDPTLRVRYYHEDHLGSSCAITDSQGDLVEEIDFHPFGLPRHDEQPRQLHDPYQFAQKERDRESGLNYFESRYLYSSAARFISTDAKYADPDKLSAGEWSALLGNPQQLNLYAYVQSNPLKYLDPTGLGPMDYMIPKTQEEYERDRKAAEDAFALPGKVWRAVKGKYDDVRNEYCFWPVENCDIDWKATFHWGKSKMMGDDDKSSNPPPKPASQPTQPPGGGTQAGAPTDAQKKVLSIVGELVNDLVGTSDDAPVTAPKPVNSDQKTPAGNSSSGHHPKQQETEKVPKVDVRDISIMHKQDAASPKLMD